MRERHVAWRHAPVDQTVERVRMPSDGGLGLLRSLLVDRDVVVPLVLGGARRPRAPEAEGDAHVGERDDGQRHEVLHDQQRNAETQRE